jgi:DNA (cytosine-5)-methyltransferase 1
MRFLSVCSGIEAASVAWQPLGWKAAAFSEIEPFPCSVLAHHYPEVPNLGDMTKFKDWPDDLSIDLLCGGTPCQSFSLAGLRKGISDPRGNLMLTYGAIAARYRPRWLVWENVPGVLSSNEGGDFGSFLGLLGQLGYGFAYRVLDAQFFGVPQRRRRVFVVGCLGDWRAAAAVLFERHSLSGHPAPSRKAGQVVTPTIRAVAPNGGAGHGARSGDSKDELIVPVARALTTSNQRIDAETETETFVVSQTLAGGARRRGGYSHDDVPMVALALTGEGFDASEDGTGRGTPLVPVAVDIRNGMLAADGPTQTMQAAGLGTERGGNPNAMPHVMAYTPQIAATMVARSSRGGGQTNSPGHQADSELIARGTQVRRLTPRECERLQGFPDDYTLIQHRGKPAADGPRYKALGNSWAVPCARWIGNRIASVDAITNKQLEAA